MDKQLFFDSLFLLTPVGESSSSSSSGEELISNCQLSVEVSSSGANIVGPVFLNTTDSTDPTMFACKLWTKEEESNDDDVVDLSQSSQASAPTKPTQQPLLLLYLSLGHQQVYQIQPARMLSVSLEQKAKDKPTSILVKFDECLYFRFFTLAATAQQLKAAYHLLKRVRKQTSPEEDDTIITVEGKKESAHKKLKTSHDTWNQINQNPLDCSKTKKDLHKWLDSCAFRGSNAVELDQEEESSNHELEDLLRIYFPKRGEKTDIAATKEATETMIQKISERRQCAFKRRLLAITS